MKDFDFDCIAATDRCDRHKPAPTNDLSGSFTQPGFSTRFRLGLSSFRFECVHRQSEDLTSFARVQVPAVCCKSVFCDRIQK